MLQFNFIKRGVIVERFHREEKDIAGFLRLFRHAGDTCKVYGENFTGIYEKENNEWVPLLILQP